MKIIGKMKKAKSWVVHYNNETGVVYGNYDYPIGLSKAETVDQAELAAALIAKQPTRPPEPKSMSYPNPRTATVEQYDAWKDHVANCNALRNWDEANVQQHWRSFDYHPVFRAVATFTGYSRGRSSVTMQFSLEGGGSLEIGPSGIDKFITGVQDGSIGRKNGGFDLTFCMDKKGGNVYMWPLYTESDFKGVELKVLPV